MTSPHVPGLGFRVLGREWESKKNKFEATPGVQCLGISVLKGVRGSEYSDGYRGLHGAIAHFPSACPGPALMA